MVCCKLAMRSLAALPNFGARSKLRTNLGIVGRFVILLSIEPNAEHGKESVVVDGFGEIIVGTGGDALFEIALHGFGSECQDGQVLEFVLSTDALHGLVAVHLGH